jgi:hypothetical protein
VADARYGETGTQEQLRLNLRGQCSPRPSWLQAYDGPFRASIIAVQRSPFTVARADKSIAMKMGYAQGSLMAVDSGRRGLGAARERHGKCSNGASA